MRMHVDFHSIQKMGLTVLFPLRIMPSLYSWADIFSPEDAARANLYELPLFPGHLLLKCRSLLLILSILLQNPLGEEADLCTA